MNLEDVSKHIKPGALPPVEKWNPPFCGDMPIDIKRDGTWIYPGTPFTRERLVRLFSTIIWREQDEYFLVTPVEKVRIKVEDAPFVAICVEKVKSEQTQLKFTDNVGNTIIASKDHPIWVNHSEQGEPSPYILVRRNLPALIHRNVFYQLVEWAKPQGKNLVIESNGEAFNLGAFEE